MDRPNCLTSSVLITPHGSLPLPAFLPDATHGVVRSVDSDDLVACGVPGLVMNAFHLMQRPGAAAVQALGGLHRMCAWERPIVTDSGGFQAYSLIRQNARFGEIGDHGITFRPEGSSRKLLLTPEKSIQRQMSFGADILVCLDDCTHVDDPDETQRQSVARTLAWARRCKREFERLLAERRVKDARRPLLFAVIQGGGDRDLRRQCAEELLAIGFDGYGYGGWPLDGEGNLLTDMLAYTRSLVPPEFPMHALGVGHPANVVAAAHLGYAIFDSAMPTRDARHGRLYAGQAPDARRQSPARTGRRPDAGEASETPGAWRLAPGVSFVYIADEKHIRSAAPISTDCDAICCRRYSLGYIHHLFKIKDSLFPRLTTIHNLRFMVRLMERLTTDESVSDENE
jgi:queuine tRNA-ribosyltransferase